MRKNILLYTIAFGLLFVVLIFFNSTYRGLTNYSGLVHRHNSVYASFLSLSMELNNAAVTNSDLIAATSDTAEGLFYTDSISVAKQIDLLKLTVRDSVNIQIVKELDILINEELSWILTSNIPDSIIEHRALIHIASFQRINSLISRGIQRTSFLINYREKQLTREIGKVRSWMFLFVVLSGILLIYTIINLFKQQSEKQRKEKELETVLNRFSDGVVSLDNNWRYTFLNDAAMGAHPLSKSETVGKVIWDMHPGMKGTIFWDKYHEAMSTRRVVEIESYYEPMDTWFSVKVYPSADGLTIFFKNVTESKKSEQKLAQTLREITDYKFALDESSIVAITDQKGIITHANSNFCRISKYSIDELIGKDHRIINSGYHSKEFIRDLWVTIAHGRIWKGELKNKAKDGTIYWVDTTIVPFLNEQGKPYQYIAIRADITMRKEAEEKIIKSEKIYKTIASSIPGSVICLLDRNYRYLLVEGDMLEKLGYSKGNLLGNKAEDVLSSEVFAEVSERFKSVLEGETVTTESTRAGYDIISRFIPLKDENNFIYAIMTVAIDITKLKNAQRGISELNRDLEQKVISRTLQLKKSNEELEAFSYSVSHDLRAPLRGIIGFVAILEEDYGSKLDEEGKRIAGVIKSNTIKMGRLIDDLLSFSRTGKQELFKTEFNTELVVKEIIEEMALQNKSNDLVTWKMGRLPSIQADINTLRQVWINLISNAVKYSSTRECPRIEIGSYSEERSIIFFVKDNGVGFEEEYSDKLFKVFQRLHDAEEFEGTGIGLALVEKIVTRHGGKVWGEGKPDEGACFYFSLPI